MGRPISLPQRQVIFQRAGLGRRAAEIAEDLGLNRETVRKLIRRFRRAGEAGIAPDYSRCGRNQPRRSDAGLIEAATAMRREHPGWGAGIIRVQLAERHPDRVIPSERTIQRAFARAGLNPAPAGRRRDGPGQRARRPRETWQMDAADQMKLAEGRQASWLRIVDECGGAVLTTVVSPPRVLEYGAGPEDPGGPSGDFRTLGPADADSGGQRHTLEVQGGSAHRPGALALGVRNDLKTAGDCPPLRSPPGPGPFRAGV